MADTIFAKASGAGRAGVAVFRLSGPDSHRIISELIGKKTVERMASYVSVRDPDTRLLIDRGLVITFRGPRSFTGEDVAELHLHGSRAVETALYETLRNAGARPAQAGEFTLRAFRNGKLDLAQVEALADLIDAETTLQRMQALGQLDGRLSRLAEDWRNHLLTIMAPLEADIDFPDEGDVPAAIAARAGPLIDQLRAALLSYLDQSSAAQTIREGVQIAVIGPPNAGKSSLVNQLAGTDIAIVSATPGTTRDIVETRLDLGGVAVTLADTAGLRTMTSDEIEAAGMTKALTRAESATLRLLVVDGSEISSYADLFRLGEDRVSRETLSLLMPGDFIVWNKSDLASAGDGASGDFEEINVSAKTGEGISGLVERLTARVGEFATSDGPALTRARHVDAVTRASDLLLRGRERLAIAPELAAEDVRLAIRALGEITGDVGVEDVLGEIFSSFCIGK